MRKVVATDERDTGAQPDFGADAPGATVVIRLLLVDDHTVVRQGLKLAFGLETDFEVVGEAENGKRALEEVERLRPDVVVMDLLMPVMNGVDATREIRRSYPEIEVVALTSILEDRMVVDVVEAGAAGYMLKESRPDELFEAVRAASRGEVRLDPRAQQRLVREVRAPQLREPLTERETEVLKHLALGRTNKGIAQQLDVTEATVKTHVSNLLAKLGLKSRTQAALHAMREGLVRREG